MVANRFILEHRRAVTVPQRVPKQVCGYICKFVSMFWFVTQDIEGGGGIGA